MVEIHSFASSAGSTEKSLSELRCKLDAACPAPDFLYVFYGCSNNSEEVVRRVADWPGDPAFIGGTSCAGVMTSEGLWDEKSIGVLAIQDTDGDFGAASMRFATSWAETAENALHLALERAGCPGELPDLIWIFQAPGNEEEVLAGLRRVVGDACPIIGGSSADDTVEGNWMQIGPDGAMADGVAVGVLFPSGGISFSFQGGYEPAGPSGVVTRVGFMPDGESGLVTKARGREIVEIDGKPAAGIYNEWVGNAIADRLNGGGSILTDTTMCPLAVDAGQSEDGPSYLLIHPEAVSPCGGLTTFATVEEGTRIYSMRGNRDRLIDRAGRVSRDAVQSLPDGAPSLAGGLVVYCAGCMLAVGDEMSRVAETVAESFKGKPFLGCFTFGEQGSVLQRNVHGNLMISAIAFGNGGR